MASSIFVWPGLFTFDGTSFIVSGPILLPDGSASAPSLAFVSGTGTGVFTSGGTEIRLATGGTGRAILSSGGLTMRSDMSLAWTSGVYNAATDTVVVRDAANTVALKNSTNAQAFRVYGYVAGSRLTRGGIQCATEAVTLSGATSSTTAYIPAGATLLNVATTTTTVITGATGYQVGDGSDADRFGDITGTAVGTSSGSANGTADPRSWATGARAITLTAKTSNFTGGVVQVTAFYLTTSGA